MYQVLAHKAYIQYVFKKVLSYPDHLKLEGLT